MLVPALIALQSLAAGETCPAPIDVQARVRDILHLAPEQQLSESFLVERREVGLYVVLKADDASVIGERTLPLEGSCDELAQAAAVVLSAWLTNVHPDFAGALPARPEPEPKPKHDASEPAAKPPPQPRQAAASAPTRRPAEPSRPAPPNPRRFDWALGAGGDLTGGALAPAALASFGHGPESFGLGLTVQVMLSTSRDEPLGPGRVRWRRWPLGVGLSLRASSPGLRWDFSAGPVVAWLKLAGENFVDDDTTNADVWGGFLGVRASGRDRFAPFAQANLQYFPGDSLAYVGGSEAQWLIPPVTLFVTLGARFAH